jgi:hypothetical protein
MGNPLTTIPGLPPAIAVSGAEQLWINQAGVDRRVTLNQIAGSISGGGAGGGGAPVVGDYGALRLSNYPAEITTIVLNDPWKGGLFVRGPAARDNGGTRINDAAGTTWYRVYDERINAAWFYSGPPDPLGNPTTLGSGPAKITTDDIAANPQWIGLADDGGVGVQTAQPYPVGTYWDFVALQEWIYACAADRSAPQTTFIGSMAGGQLTISQWLVGPHSLTLGQPVTGAGVQPGTIVVALTSDPNVYWTGAPHISTAFVATTASGNTFRCWVTNTVLTIPSYGNPASTIVVGDEIIDPLYPPNSYYNGLLPGTTIGPQIDGTPGGPGDYAAAVAQAVGSEQMLGVGGPTWNTVNGNYNLNVPGYCPRGHMYLNQMLVCNGNGLDLLFASKLGTMLYWYGNAVNGVGNIKVGPALKFNTLAYSVVHSLAMSDQSGGVTNYLVSLSHTSTGAPGLNVENNSLSDWVINGNYSTSQCGVAISPEGGSAQGDTQVFNQCWVTGFNVGFRFGGDNAIAGTFFGGQTQSCPQYGVQAAGGSFSAYTMLCENSITNYYATPQRTQVHLGGADFYAQQVSTESCVVIGCRSESVVGMIDFSHESSVMNWTTGGFFYGWSPNAHWPPGTLLHVSAAGGTPVENFGLVMIADDGGPPWFYGTTDATGLIVTVVAPPNAPPGWTPPNWTPNQWAGLGVWRRAGTNAASNAIASNTANTLTLVAAVTANAATWWKIFASSGAVAPNWGATTHFGQFQRNATGWGATIAQGFNLFSSASPIIAGDWVMIPGFDVFPDGSGITQALWGKAVNQHPASSGFYANAFGTVANVWGTPTNPILLGSSVGVIPFNFLIAQTSGSPGGVGAYTLAFASTVGADFTGSASASQLTVTAVANGAITAGQSLGGAGISTAPAPTITNAGAAITGYIDDGTGGTTPGGVLTITAILNGVTVLGAPLTGTDVGAGTVVLSLISGAQLAVTPSQLLPRCVFTASITAAGAVLTVTAVSAGQLVQGQLIQGAGIPANLFLGAQISGVTGGIGSYSVNQPINIASEAMTAVWAMSVGGQGAGFTARIDNGTTPDTLGNQLTVTAVSRGVLGVGQTINVPLTGGPTGATQQLTITALVTGAGGTGVYALSGSANVASTTMSANTTNGIGVYGVSPAFGAPISSQVMFSGYAAATPALWELRDTEGDPMNSALYGIDAFGYYSAGISDGGLTQMVIDFDIMWGVGAMDQCELPFGKVGSIARLDNARSPAGVLTSQFIRPGEGPLGQFAYKNAVTYAPPPRFGVVANTSPFTIGTSFLTQSNVFATVYQNNTVLGLTALGPGMVADIDLKLTPGANIGGGMIVDWDPTAVKSASPTLNIGAPNQNTIVRLKWIGNSSTTAPGGFWYVSSVQGPM